MFGFLKSAVHAIAKPFAAVGHWTANHWKTIATIAVSTVAFVVVTVATGGLDLPAAACLLAGGFASGVAGYATGNLLDGQKLSLGAALLSGGISALVTVATAGLLRFATPALTSLAAPVEAAIPAAVREAVPAVVARTAFNSSLGGALGAGVKAIENGIQGRPIGQGVGEAAIEGGINGALLEPAMRLVGAPVSRALAGDEAVTELSPEETARLSPGDRAQRIGELVGGSAADREAALGLLASASDLERFETLRALDRSNDTTVRRVYDALDDQGKARFLELAQTAAKAASAAGAQPIGVVSDCDDTAFPTQYTPDGVFSFKGSADFYRLLSTGTDGQGDPGNLHFVTARIPELLLDTRARIEAAGLPSGTFDGDASISRFLFGGLDGIEQSKIENLDLWFKLHPGQKFVLLGDSLQRDPEVYAWAIKNHPDQVEAVLIHRAGGPVRDPAGFQGQIWFDDYGQAQEIVRNLGIAQPGARQPSTPLDLSSLPPPDTDVSQLTAQEKSEGFFTKVKDQVEENVGSLVKDVEHKLDPDAETSSPSPGIVGALGKTVDR
jgi:hypothetical protein